MPTHVTEEAEQASVAGVLFTTSSRPGTEDERLLQVIQEKLADGIVQLPEVSSLPQLALALAATLDGPTISVITLWVPKSKESEAVTLLEAAGFHVSD